ncbi:MAG TPA: nucleoside deaminase [Comamonas sp.]
MRARFLPTSTHAATLPHADEYLLNNTDNHWLRQAFIWANAARIRGNRPFGAMVVSSDGRILAEAFSNTQETGDITGHAEMNAVRQLSTARLTHQLLAGATLYCSAEPCAMCASAICASGLRRVIYGLDWPRLQTIRPDLRPVHLSCHDVFANAHESIECTGPCLVDEALAVYEDHWFSAHDNTGIPPQPVP